MKPTVVALVLFASASARASTVDDHVPSDCSTDVVLPLAAQVAGEVDCLLPGQMVPMQEGDGVVFSGTVLPFLDASAKADLLVVASGGEADVNSGYRTVPQQYLLYRWWQDGRCGITAAATPGSSNHESGRAVDLNNWADLVGAMAANGWSHDVPGDDVHFDHLSSPDIRGSDVLAFQKLWNVNRPDQPIDEDGAWGPMTAAALGASPAEGFAQGPSCEEGTIPILPILPTGGGNPDDPGDASGGCSAGGGGGFWLAALALLRIRTRSRPAA